jgi:hypothetical protein
MHPAFQVIISLKLWFAGCEFIILPRQVLDPLVIEV